MPWSTRHEHTPIQPHRFFPGEDLHRDSRPVKCDLEHRAFDGSIVHDLPRASQGSRGGGAFDRIADDRRKRPSAGACRRYGPGIREFAASLGRFRDDLPIRPVFDRNVFDPTLEDDGRNFLGIDPAQTRGALDRTNNAIASVAARHGTLVDLHAHFVTGEESCFTRTIEPSLIGASEVRRCFLDKILGNPI
jgi:hypothetical protein